MARSANLALASDRDDESIAEVFNHPILDVVPPTRLPLNEAGKEAYVEWTQKLFAVGKLTDVSRVWVEQYASAEHDLYAAMSGGKSSRYPSEQKARWFRKIEKLYGSSDTPQAGGSSENPYAHFGFAKRARQRRHDQD